MISEDRGLSRAAGKYREDDLVELFRGMDAFVEEALPFSLFEGIVKFSASRMAEWTKKKFTPPRHKLFELCDCYHRAIRQRFLALKAELILYCRDRLPKRKKRRISAFSMICFTICILLFSTMKRVRLSGFFSVAAGLQR